MEKLSNPQKTIEIIKKYEFAFQKKFGQNFLIDGHVLDKIIAASGVTKEDCVVEIGPGIGTLTQYLAEAAREVVSIEIDKMLIPILHETLAEYDNVTIINQDVLKVDLEEIVRERCGGRPVKVVANLPYYITTPIIMTLFESRLPIASVTVMVQKEVAARMQAGPGTKDYGALSLAVQYFAQPYIAANVPPNCFMPRPRVGSAVIRLTRHETPPVQVKDEAAMFRVIRASFNQRRKTLVNGLNNAPQIPYPKEAILEALRRMGLSQTIRGEALTLEQFAELTDLLEEAPAGGAATEDTAPGRGALERDASGEEPLERSATEEAAPDREKLERDALGEEALERDSTGEKIPDGEALERDESGETAPDGERPDRRN